MGVFSSFGGVLLNVLRAGFQAATGVPAPGAPASASTIATVLGSKITFSQLVTTAKALEGSKLGDEFKVLIANIGNVDNDLDVTQQIAALLAPYLPVAGEVATALFVVKLAYDGAQMLYAADPAAFAPAPRGGPPITEADWSHGLPQAQPVDNPSGAVGGPGAQ